LEKYSRGLIVRKLMGEEKEDIYVKISGVSILGYNMHLVKELEPYN